MELASTKSKRTKKRKNLFLFIVCIIFAWWGIRHIPRGSDHIISPLPDNPSPTTAVAKPFTLFAKKKTADDLTQKINAVIGDKWDNYSIMVDGVSEPFTLEVSETEIFTGASVNKIPILAALYYFAQKGDIDLDQVITLQANEIQDYGTGSIRYDSPGTTYSLKTLARLMMKQSDNTAAYILATEIIGFDRLADVLTQWGLSQTDMVNNKTSNKDMDILMRKIYEEKITNHAQTLEMLSFMKDTDFEARLPGNLPDGVTVYHKIGTEVRTIHDVGIVTNGKLTYYVGIFTTDVDDDPSTEELMAKISKTIYDYLL
jgi:beta-lactamase class A